MSLIIASLVLWSGISFGPEQAYLNGTTFNSDAQFNYEPVVGALPPATAADPDYIFYADVYAVCCDSVNPPPPPRLEDVPEPCVYWGFVVGVCATLLARRIL